MIKASKSISPFRLSSLLRNQKDPALALQLFQNPNPDSNAQPQKPFRYSLISYDIIISKLGRAKMFDQMEQILGQMKQETHLSPPEIIFCNVMSYYGRARLPDRALPCLMKCLLSVASGLSNHSIPCWMLFSNVGKLRR
ncbi:hypothetical protein ACLB2K_051977 [Fragaria x ananassa]